VGRDRVKVWLDDVRDAPPGWVRAFTPEEVIGLLQLGKVTELSLDHDLGLADGVSERTGYTVLLWLEAEVGTGRWTRPLPEIAVHSGNPVGRDRMLRVVRTIRQLHAMRSARRPTRVPRGAI
jgi:NAD+-processing family protein with receiver domain